MNRTLPAAPVASRWPTLYGPSFDAAFIVGTLALALALGAAASLSPAWFVAVLSVDILLFANPHVVATFTRIAGRDAGIRRHWFLVAGLPPLVLLAVTMVAAAYDLGGLFTLYLLAQAWHVTRQTFGIARAYERVDGGTSGHEPLADAVIHLFPLWGLLHRCAQGPATFYGHPLHLPVVSPMLADAAGVAALAVCGLWVARQLRRARSGECNASHVLFVASHLVVMGVAWLLVTDITLGWLIVNIWHNVQYLLFVWVRNYRRDVPPAAAAIGKHSGPLVHAAKYIALCLVLGFVLYAAMEIAGERLAWLGLPTVFILHFTVSFHHYLADAVIWKRRRVGTMAPT